MKKVASVHEALDIQEHERDDDDACFEVLSFMEGIGLLRLPVTLFVSGCEFESLEQQELPSFSPIPKTAKDDDAEQAIRRNSLRWLLVSS